MVAGPTAIDGFTHALSILDPRETGTPSTSTVYDRPSRTPNDHDPIAAVPLVVVVVAAKRPRATREHVVVVGCVRDDDDDDDSGDGERIRPSLFPITRTYNSIILIILILRVVVRDNVQDDDTTFPLPATAARMGSSTLCTLYHRGNLG